MKDKGSPPSGTRDFFGAEVRRRGAAVRTISEVFESFGFDPLETPAFERLEVLTGKYGEDEKLIFKIARRGAKEATGEADLALRYDLTVPLARFIAGNPQVLTGTLRRYQIGPVWRADRPARGRFREFYQCDVDIVGSASPLADAEVILALGEALRRLGLTEYTFRLNSRSVLSALMSVYGVPAELEKSFLNSIDKLYKVGIDAVAAELAERGVPAGAIEKVTADQRSAAPDAAVSERLTETEQGRAALTEVRDVETLVRPNLRAGRIVFDPFIARGLDYYTGCVFECFYEGDQSLPLSIASGGRYDGLMGTIGDQAVPACGGSIGFERILLLLENAADTAAPAIEVLVTCWDETYAADALSIATALRRDGIRAETYLASGGLKAQLRQAARREAKVCVIYGPNDRAQGTVTVRNLDSGEQTTGPREEVTRLVRERLRDDVPSAAPTA
ncbi:MAG: histidine--tRNA ligase [Frankia sp.]|nr:histidine--tRNA ligase [Frankia sp.]